MLVVMDGLEETDIKYGRWGGGEERGRVGEWERKSRAGSKWKGKGKVRSGARWRERERERELNMTGFFSWVVISLCH